VTIKSTHHESARSPSQVQGKQRPEPAKIDVSRHRSGALPPETGKLEKTSASRQWGGPVDLCSAFDDGHTYTFQ